MSELAEWSQFLEAFTALWQFTERKKNTIELDQEEQLSTYENTHPLDKLLDVQDYKVFLETSGILQRILSILPQHIERPIFIQEKWPIKANVGCALENGKLVYMFLGNNYSYATCKMFRL